MINDWKKHTCDSAKNAAQLCAVQQSDKCSAALVFENDTFQTILSLTAAGASLLLLPQGDQFYPTHTSHS